MRSIIMAFLGDVAASRSTDELAGALEAMTLRMGFDHFALTHHVDIPREPGTTLRLHNYLASWVEYFDRHHLGISDPIHRASQKTSVGFPWRDVPDLIVLTPFDRQILARARDHGLSDGFTVPAYVPGEAHGSCSFVSSNGAAHRSEDLPLAQLAGAFAFEGARRLLAGGRMARPSVQLTDRQRDCLLWVARGKTDWEISLILDVSQETVVRHLKDARERYDVQKRTSLLVRTLFDGTITFGDVIGR